VYLDSYIQKGHLQLIKHRGCRRFNTYGCWVTWQVLFKKRVPNKVHLFSSTLSRRFNKNSSLNFMQTKAKGTKEIRPVTA